MRWHREVLHVARKDVRAAFGPVLVYLLVLACATVSSIWGRDLGLGSYGWRIMVVIAAMAVVAVLVQGDSPARNDAFWITRPLRPSAVFGAKLIATLVTVILPGLLAQALALRLHDVAAPDYLPLLLSSARDFGLWLAGAGVVASLTRDLRSFIVAFMVGFTGLALFMGAAFARIAAGPGGLVFSGYGSLPGAAIATFLLALTGIMAHQYSSRRVRHGVLLAVGLAAVSAMALAWTPLPRLGGTGTSADAPPALIAPAVSALLVVPESGDAMRPELLLVLANASGTHRYRPGGMLEVQRADGEAERYFFNTGHIIVSADRADPAARDTLVLPVWLALPAPALDELRRGQANARVRGWIDIAEPRALGSLALDRPATLAANGTRLRFLGWRDEGSGPEPILRVSTVAYRWTGLADRLESYQRNMALDYTFIHAMTADTVPLARSSSFSGQVGLVLPGATATGEQLRFRSVRGDTVDQARRATDVRVTRWDRLGGYPVELDATIRTATGPSDPNGTSIVRQGTREFRLR